ncbi:hypothetical protein HMF3257_38505 [Spirosoma telluris]|uniref:Uncharacterized protein n=1 Tax=Spirosoma telluris TaxID=2183553 RepID=A0A327ND65_9BACT|nr:hypothetical protein HMF3257_38505 [Spirosoma telluris]
MNILIESVMHCFIDFMILYIIKSMIYRYNAKIIQRSCYAEIHYIKLSKNKCIRRSLNQKLFLSLKHSKDAYVYQIFNESNYQLLNITTKHILI